MVIKSINTLNFDTRVVLQRWLSKTDPSHPILFSFDIDQTLIDRTISTHHIDNRIVSAIALLEGLGESVILNTGRGLEALKRLDQVFNKAHTGIFLSGRGLRTSSRVTFDPSALLSEGVFDRAIDLLIQGSIPYLEIKDAAGSLKLVANSELAKSYAFGFQRPADWYEGLVIAELEITNKEKAIGIVLDRNPMKLEIPLFYSLIGEVLEQGQNSNDMIIARCKDYLGIRDMDLCCEIRSVNQDFPSIIGNANVLQLLTPIKQHNKGVGLHKFCLTHAIPTQNVCHFGDSRELHNSDLLVGSEVSNSLLVWVGTTSPSIDDNSILVPSISDLPNFLTDTFVNALRKERRW